MKHKEKDVAPRLARKMRAPKSRLIGGDRLRGSSPLAPGHAGRTRLGIFITALLAFLLVLSPLKRGVAFAASAQVTESTKTSVGAYDRFALDGQVAYCGESYLQTPAVGHTLQKYDGAISIPELDYVLYHGYDGKTVTSISGLSASDSRAATQAAVWLAIADQRVDLFSHKGTVTGNTIPGNTTYNEQLALLQANNSKAAAAAKELYNAALAYKKNGGGGVESGFATLFFNTNLNADGKLCQHLVRGGVKTGSLALEKQSAQSEITKNNAAYSLEGATYAVYSDKSCTKKVGELSCDANGKSNTLSELSPGEYFIKETKAPRGFVLDGTVHTATVVPGEKTVLRVSDEPIVRDDWALVQKLGEGDGKDQLKGTEFTVEFFGNIKGDTSGTPLQTWVFSSNEDGRVAFDKGELKSGELFKSFGEHTNPLPLGSYLIKETQAPFGYRGIDDAAGPFLAILEEVSGKATWKIVGSWGTADADEAFEQKAVRNKRLPQLATSLREHGDQLCPAVNEVTLVDSVDCNYLIPEASYKIVGELYDKESGELLGVASELEFVAESAHEVKELHFELTTSELAGHTIVAFETLFEEGEEVASHKDLDDIEQSVSLPKIKTTLSDAEGNKEVLGSGNITLVDRVSYENLDPEREYQLVGELVDKETGEKLGVTSQISFTPRERSGEVDLTFEFDGELVLGKTVVAFETLMFEEREYAVHADINDEAQTVRIPRIQTQASLKEKELPYLAAEMVQLVDRVSYENLEPGKSYVLEASLIDKSSGEPVELLVDVIAGTEEHAEAGGTDGAHSANNEKLTGSQTTSNPEHRAASAKTSFVPDEPNGTVDVEFALDAGELAGKTFVVFERLSQDERLVAQHMKLDAKEQSLYVPKVDTTFSGEDGVKELSSQDTFQLVDEVRYSGLEEGASYQLVGMLFDKATGELVQEAASKSFVAEASEGSTAVSFELSAQGLGTKELVAFERLYYEGELIASHEDLSSPAQTVVVHEIVPRYPLPQTGDNSSALAPAVAGATGLALVSVGTIALRLKKEH